MEPNLDPTPGGPIELSVIVPCLNEELNIPELTERLLRTFDVGGFPGEVVLVDDGSSDGTASVIRAMMAAHGGHDAGSRPGGSRPGAGSRVTGVFHPTNLGIAEGWKSGARASSGKLVATIDADLQYQPEDLLRLRRALYEHAVDVVQGWRSAVGRRKDRRYTLSRGLNALLNGVFSMHLQDNKSGFVICAREVFEDLCTYRGSYFYWQSFVMVAAHAKGYSYKQVETLFEQRRQGTSFLEGANAFKASAKSIADLAVGAIEYRVTAPPPDQATQFLRRHPVSDLSPPQSPASRLRFRACMAAFNQTHWMMTRDVEHYYETLRKTQWLDAARLRDLQDEKLRRMVRHVYRNVPYYRRTMQEQKIRPEDIRGQADLHKLPLLTKGDVRRHLYFDIMSENHDKSQILKISTSGSTGEPFVCYADRAQLEVRWAAALRAEEWTGYRFGDPALRLQHPALGTSRSQAAREIAAAGLSNRTLIPVFELSDEKLSKMIDVMVQTEPVLMDGDAEVLDFIARHLEAAGRADVRPRALMSSAQTLPLQSRERIERAFGCRVFDEYGSREFSGVAYECDAHAGHHVVAEAYIVEVLNGGRPARPGELGEVVITDLDNFCMPFIRYRIGDLAEAMDPAAPCPCGRAAPRLGAVEGRVQSIIQGTDGRCVPGTFFAHYLKELDYAIKQFQIVQEERDAIRFRVVRGGRFSQEVIEEALATFRGHLGQRMRIDVEFVDAIPPARRAGVSGLGVDLVQASPVVARNGAREH